jgi:hypothetical protein
VSDENPVEEPATVNLTVSLLTEVDPVELVKVHSTAASPRNGVITRAE